MRIMFVYPPLSTRKVPYEGEFLSRAKAEMNATENSYLNFFSFNYAKNHFLTKLAWASFLKIQILIIFLLAKIYKQFFSAQAYVTACHTSFTLFLACSWMCISVCMYVRARTRAIVGLGARARVCVILVIGLFLAIICDLFNWFYFMYMS